MVVVVFGFFIYENLLAMSNFFLKICQIKTPCRPSPSVIILVIDNRATALRSSDFVFRSYDYRPNWTPLGPITIINLSLTSFASRI